MCCRLQKMMEDHSPISTFTTTASVLPPSLVSALCLCPALQIHYYQEQFQEHPSLLLGVIRCLSPAPFAHRWHSDMSQISRRVGLWS